MMYVDTQCGEKCWNLLDSYGEICVHCGCCAKDKKTRYENRIRVIERWIEEWENFDDWLEGLEKVQEENQRSNIRYFKKQLRYCKRKLKECADGKMK